MTTTAKTIVNLDRLPRDTRFKNWTKTLVAVDASKTNGYCFEGEFVSGLAELPVGTILLHYHEEGSRGNHDPYVDLWKVSTEGLEKLAEYGNLPEKWALAIRDKVAAELESAKPSEREALEAEAKALRARLAEIEARLAS